MNWPIITATNVSSLRKNLIENLDLVVHEDCALIVNRPS